jgi:hypothetical protein
MFPSVAGCSTDTNWTELFDIGSRLEEDSVPELKSAFGVAAKATEALVTKFVGLGGEHHSKYRRKDEHFDCQTEVRPFLMVTLRI